MKKFQYSVISSIMAACCMFSTPISAYAHGAWFAQRTDRTQLVVGEGWKDNGYDTNGLLMMNAYNSKYASTAIQPLKGDNYIYIDPSDDVSVVDVVLDYGYWSNNAAGEWIPKPMDQVEGSTIGTHALKYSVNYLKSVDNVQPMYDMAYQFVPFTDPTKLNIGDVFAVQLLHNGQPMPNQDIIPDVTNHHTVTTKTDANGIAYVTAVNGGTNVIGCEMVVPYENEGVDKKATRSKVFVSLSYTLYPEETD